MVRTQGSPQRLVLGDWGTSRLRLALIEGDDVVATRDGPGIGALSIAPGDTLATLVAPWLRDAEILHVVLSGMVGSRNGLAEAPYASTPCDFATWSNAALRTQLPGMQIAIAAGLKDESRDVMRGEETQIFGAMQLDPTLRDGSHLLVLPGTHSKWAEVKDGAVVRFHTALTGELFALLRDHSILLKTGGAVEADPVESDAGFAAGVTRSAHLPEGLLNVLFEVRTAQLLGQRSGAWATGFLSGLLIGAEAAGMSALHPAVRAVSIIGDVQLAQLYRRVCAARGVNAAALDGSACALAGLRRLSAVLHQGEQWI
jgi:2-dehydro-3-deoxygalactonokinase